MKTTSFLTVLAASLLPLAARAQVLFIESYPFVGATEGEIVTFPAAVGSLTETAPYCA